MTRTLYEVFKLLKHKRFTVSTAESCTGGLLGAAFTDIAGSSEIYIGGVIAYNNIIKSRFLDVPQSILDQYGAVSNQTVSAMAQGVQNRFKTECALSTSGIAGPSGGTPQKPVGLVYIGIAVGSMIQSFKYNFDGDRQAVRKQAVEMAILNFYEILNK